MSPEMKHAVDFLYAMPRFTKKNSLEHTRQLMRLLGSPCVSRKVIHIAGSNGKGSVSCFLYHMLLADKKSVALFTSPHLVDIRERFQVNDELASEEKFLEIYRRVREASNRLAQKTGSYPTFFEFLFAMGMVIFEQADVEYIVLETGLGGRLDATNSFPMPILTVITSISLEHTEYLGDTLAEIASEKAGIIKPGVPVVFSANAPEAETVIRARGAELGCPCAGVYAYEEKNAFSENADKPSGDILSSGQKMFQICEMKENDIDFFLWNDYHGKTKWRIPFSAPYQAENAAVAVTAMQMLKRMRMDAGHRREIAGTDAKWQALANEADNQQEFMSDAVIQQGLSNTRWPGRMQQIRPDIYFDGAHNPSGISAFTDSVRALAKNDTEPPMLLFSMVRDKDIRTSVSLLAGVPWDTVAVTTIPGERGTPVAELARIFTTETGQLVEVYDDYRDAWKTMLQKKHHGQKLFCAGSLYFIGALLKMTEDNSW